MPAHIKWHSHHKHHNMMRMLGKEAASRNNRLHRLSIAAKKKLQWTTGNQFCWILQSIFTRPEKWVTNIGSRSGESCGSCGRYSNKSHSTVRWSELLIVAKGERRSWHCNQQNGTNIRHYDDSRRTTMMMMTKNQLNSFIYTYNQIMVQ